MNIRNKPITMTFVTLAVIVLIIASAQAQSAVNKPTDNSLRNRSEFRLDLFRIPARRQNLLLRPASFSLMPRNAGVNASAMTVGGAPSLPVVGSGTVGKLTKWTGITGSNSVIGDSNIFEDKFGKVGIGTTTPTSPLTVQGMIEITLGGLKFPDGTLQTTSAAGALFSVAHDTTLRGNGTIASPLGVAIPLILSGSVPNGAVFFAQNASDGGDGVVGIAGKGGTGVTASGGSGGTGVRAQGGNSSGGPGGFGVVTFGGDGITFGGPGVFAQGGNGNLLSGTGVIATGGEGGIGVDANGGGTSSGNGGDGVRAQGGLTLAGTGGRGVIASGGGSADGDGGAAVSATGGSGNGGSGGAAVSATGGGGNGGSGGAAVSATGGGSISALAGAGVVATGGNSVSGQGGGGVGGFGGSSLSGNGGVGMRAVGGTGTGAGSSAGTGITAVAGSGADGASNGLAGLFEGDVEVNGNLTKASGSFKIDHPLDPENKYLYHSFVESPDMKNIYDGLIRLDANGEATVAMPEWFSALNRDFRYFLTAIGAPMPGLYIAEELQDNRFRVAGGQPGMKVSWQVTGVRQDAYANKNRIKVEEEKTERERGSYLHPEAFNQPEERGVEWVRNPELMQRIKEARKKALKAKQD